MEKEICLHETEFQQLKTKADNHVTWTMFWSIVIVLSGIFGTVMKTNYERITVLERSTNDDRIVASVIKTQLSQIQSDVLDIKLSLREHDSVGKMK